MIKYEIVVANQRPLRPILHQNPNNHTKKLPKTSYIHICILRTLSWRPRALTEPASTIKILDGTIYAKMYTFNFLAISYYSTSLDNSAKKSSQKRLNEVIRKIVRQTIVREIALKYYMASNAFPLPSLFPISVVADVERVPEIPNKKPIILYNTIYVA